MEKLFEFNYELNNTFCDFSDQNSCYTDKIKLLLSHIINAQEIWITRIKNEKSALQIWEEHNPEELKKYNKLHFEQFREIIATHPMKEIITYKDLSGNPYTTSVSDILNHVAFHGTHHRAQVAQILSAKGLKPPLSDYIYYIRKAKI